MCHQEAYSYGKCEEAVSADRSGDLDSPAFPIPPLPPNVDPQEVGEFFRCDEN